MVVLACLLFAATSRGWSGFVAWPLTLGL